MWKMTITRVSNGYKITYPPNHKGTLITEIVIQETEDELKIHEELLWMIMEYFDFSGSKHDIERIRIIREKQN